MEVSGGGGEDFCDEDGAGDNPVESREGGDDGGNGNDDDLVVEENDKGVDEVGSVGEPREGAEWGQRQHLSTSSSSVKLGLKINVDKCLPSPQALHSH